MNRESYAKQHIKLGLCRRCPKPFAQGSNSFCEYHRMKERMRGRVKDKKYQIRVKGECIEHYGGKCACCNETILQFLTIDHNEGNGNHHRKSLFKHNVGGIHIYRWLKRNNYPSEYSVLCMNCNWAKRYSNICPHQLGEIA
jgi:hypothetical protein